MTRGPAKVFSSVRMAKSMKANFEMENVMGWGFHTYPMIKLAKRRYRNP